MRAKLAEEVLDTCEKHDLKDENVNDYADKVLKSANLISKKLGA